MAAILIADDDDAFQEMLATFLEAEGHHIHRAVDPVQMSVLLREHKHDLVVLDMEMPGGGAKSALQSLQSLSDATPIIFCSGRTIEEMQEAFKPTPRRRYLSKPVDLLKLKACVDTLLAEPKTS